MPREPPKVTGLSPMKGPPGTKIKIRGENLGLSGDDVIGVFICDIDCLLYAEWKSPTQILTRSGRCIGTGDVIVVTKSGGIGTSTVQFFGYEEKVGLTIESAVWVDEPDFIVGGMQRPSISQTSIDSGNNDLLGIAHKLRNGSLFSPTRRQSVIRDLKDCFSGLNETKIDEYGDIMSSEFIPAWCLVTQYNSASLQDLRDGLQNLKTKAKTQDRQEQRSSFDEDFDQTDLVNDDDDSQQRAAFLKANIIAIIECLDVLKSLHLAFKKDKQDSGQDLTSRVDSSVLNSLNEAHAIFDSILSKKDLADATRSALNILQRYRFLFNLPSIIEKSLQRGDYDVVINEFAKAKSLFATTQVSVFKRVYQKIEHKIHELREALDKKLADTCRASTQPRDIDEVKKTIRQLNSLDDNRINHAWKSIVRLHASLVESIKECHDRHLRLAIETTQTNSPKVTRTSLDTIAVSESDVPKLIKSAPHVVQFVDEVTTIFNENFLDLYRLGLAYFNEEFLTKEETHTIEIDFGHEMIFKSLEVFCRVLRAALIPPDSAVGSGSKRSGTIDANQPKWPFNFDDRFVVWIKHVLRCVINSRAKLIKAELPNYAKEALEDLRSLLFELRVQSMEVLFKQAAVDVEMMSFREDWEIDVDDLYGGRTQLPLLFERKVIESLQLGRDTIFQTTSSDETGLFTQIHVQASMKQSAQKMFLSFLSALDKTLKNTSSCPAEENYNLQASIGSLRASSNSNNRRLVVICNCLFTTDQVFPRLRDQFEKLQYPDMNLVMKKCHEMYVEYEKKIFDAYCEAKYEDMRKSSSIRQSEDVQTHFNLLEVRSQVFLIAPPLVEKVIDCLKERLYSVNL